MQKQKTSQTIDVIFVLVLFCTFAAAILMVLLTGASSYKGIVATMEEHYEERTALSYIEAKAHHYDLDGAIAVGQYADQNALQLQEKVNGRSYSTWIYYYDGYVRELFCEDGLQLTPDTGQKIIEAQAFAAEYIEDNLLRVVCTGKSGNQAELFLHIRSIDRGGQML